MIEVYVKTVAIDSITGSPIVLLADINNPDDIYPIWIGTAEAEGIVVKKSGFIPPRPLTYDLFKNTIEALGGKLKHVSIVNMINNTYIAELVIQKDGKEVIIDARPSDAINLALRFNAPIYINEEIVKKLSSSYKEITEQPQNITSTKDIGIKDEDLEKFREMLNNIKPDDFLIKDNSQTQDINRDGI